MIDTVRKQQQDYTNLNKRLNQYATNLQLLIDDLIASVTANITAQPSFPTLFSLDNQHIDNLLEEYSTSAYSLIHNAQAAEWTAANLATDILVNGIVEQYLDYISPTRRAAYFLVNQDALTAFQARRISGLSLSNRIWNLSQQMKTQLEQTIATAIQNGTPAANLARQTQAYIANPQKHHLNTHDTHAITMRLARSEINMAYRTAEQTRWKQLDFVVGYRILLSHKHNKTDICDILKGKYPKSFTWTGWHPCDLCYAIPILKTENELWAVDYDNNLSTKSVNEITDVPDNFKKYIEENKTKIEKMKNKPFFVKDNEKFCHS